MEAKVSARSARVAALRSQLNQITLASQILENCAVAERSRAYLAVINQGVCRMLRIVGHMELEQLLSAESPRPSSSCTDLAPWLEALCLRLEGILASIGVTFTFTCPSTLLAHIDRALLQQLLLELIAHLALAGTQINLAAVRQGQNIHFTVSDSGPGAAKGRPVMPDALESQEEASSLDYARRISELLGGTLILSPAADLGLSLAASIPVGELPASGRLDAPKTVWNDGGFDPALVALSELLPADAFLPEELD